MELLFAFAPFLVFAVVQRVVGVMPGLIAGTIVACGLLLRDWIDRRRTVKVLDAGTVLLFGGLSAWALASGATWSIVGVRLRVDLGLLLVVLASLALRRPFTLQYAREQTPAEIWSKPEFIRTNYVITAVWAGAFLAMVAADLLLLFVPAVRPGVGIMATVLALYGAFRFTAWYPERVRAQAGQSQLR